MNIIPFKRVEVYEVDDLGKETIIENFYIRKPGAIFSFILAFTGGNKESQEELIPLSFICLVIGIFSAMKSKSLIKKANNLDCQ